jgi:hypothetical protein
VVAISPVTKLSLDFKAGAIPEVNFEASRCAEPAADGGMLNASRMSASFVITVVLREMYLQATLLDQMMKAKLHVRNCVDFRRGKRDE